MGLKKNDRDDKDVGDCQHRFSLRSISTILATLFRSQRPTAKVYETLTGTEKYQLKHADARGQPGHTVVLFDHCARAAEHA
jgi:hypothetical protein